jgi:hypothetical protein
MFKVVFKYQIGKVVSVHFLYIKSLACRNNNYGSKGTKEFNYIFKYVNIILKTLQSVYEKQITRPL